MPVLLTVQVPYMPDLPTFLRLQVKESSLRSVEAKTGVSKSAIENIIKRRNEKLPEIETLQKIATAYDLRLWQVVEMAGVSLGLPESPTERSRRLEDLAVQNPPLGLIVDYLLNLAPQNPDFVDGMLIYMETAAQHQLKRG